MSDFDIGHLSTFSQNMLSIGAIVFAVLMAIYCIKKKQARLVTILLVTIIGFLLTYALIFEFWVFGTGTIWPNGFFPGAHNKLEPVVRGFPFANTTYFILSTVSTSLLIFSIITLINVVQKRVESERKWVHQRLRVPLLNMWYIALEMFKFLRLNRWYQAIVVPWFIAAALWLYYKFLAGGVLRMGWDSYAIWDFKFLRTEFQSRMNETVKTLSPNIDLKSTITYYHFLSNVIVTLVTFCAGIFTAGMVHGVRWIGKRY